jgi:hypothetical protein
MAASRTLLLTGRSGASYTFYLFPWGEQLKAIGGVYAVLRQDPTQLTVLYAGQTGDLSERFDNHHRAADFRQSRASHLAALGVETEVQRRQIETDLVRYYDPPLNQTGHG